MDIVLDNQIDLKDEIYSSSGLTVSVFCFNLYNSVLNLYMPILSQWHFTLSFHVQFHKFPVHENKVLLNLDSIFDFKETAN
jgi:hypothetical protein